MKSGQAFLITAVIAILLLALIKTSTNFQLLSGLDKNLEVGLRMMEFQNVKEEIIKSMEYSIYEKNGILKNAETFLRFAKSSFKNRTIELNSIFLGCTIPNVSGAATMNIAILNLLGEEILELSLSFSYDNSAQNFSRIADGEKIETSFAFEAYEDINHTLSLWYRTSSLERSERLTIPIEIGKSKFLGFFDLRLNSYEFEQRDKFTKVYLLP